MTSTARIQPAPITGVLGRDGDALQQDDRRAYPLVFLPRRHRYERARSGNRDSQRSRQR